MTPEYVASSALLVNYKRPSFIGQTVSLWDNFWFFECQWDETTQY